MFQKHKLFYSGLQGAENSYSPSSVEELCQGEGNAQMQEISIAIGHLLMDIDLIVIHLCLGTSLMAIHEYLIPILFKLFVCLLKHLYSAFLPSLW